MARDGARIRTLIADDHPLLRAGLRAILEETPDVDVIGEVADGGAVTTAARGADVVLLDVSMPGPGLGVVLDRLHGLDRAPRVLVLSVHDERHYAVEAVRAGAAGYLTKDCAPRELVDAVRAVARGERYVTPRVAEHLAAALAHPEHAPVPLSSREREVLAGLASGLSGKEIGARLNLSPKTVSTYRSRLLEKLGLRSTADLIRYAIERGVIE